MAAASVTTLNEVYAAATQWREEWRYVSEYGVWQDTE